MLTTETTERDLITEAGELLAHPDVAQWAGKSVRDLLRRLVEEVKRLRERIKTVEHEAREDAQAAASEARWQERQGDEYGSY